MDSSPPSTQLDEYERAPWHRVRSHNGNDDGDDLFMIVSMSHCLFSVAVECSVACRRIIFQQL